MITSRKLQGYLNLKTDFFDHFFPIIKVIDMDAHKNIKMKEEKMFRIHPKTHHQRKPLFVYFH